MTNAHSSPFRGSFRLLYEMDILRKYIPTSVTCKLLSNPLPLSRTMVIDTAWKHVNKYTNTSWQFYIPYILESNPHPFYTYGGLKNQMRIRIACGLDSRSSAGFWKNDRAAVRAVRKIQFIILYNIYNLLFIRLAVITHNWIVIRHPVTIIFIFTIVLL